MALLIFLSIAQLVQHCSALVCFCIAYDVAYAVAYIVAYAVAYDFAYAIAYAVAYTIAFIILSKQPFRQRRRTEGFSVLLRPKINLIVLKMIFLSAHQNRRTIFINNTFDFIHSQKVLFGKNVPNF